LPAGQGRSCGVRLLRHRASIERGTLCFMTDSSPAAGPAPEAGSLVLAATPIGNAEDASPRLVRLLAGADVVAAEDTRRLHALAARLGVQVRGSVTSYHEHNETARADDLPDVVAGGGTVVVGTDAGMPAGADPRYRGVARVLHGRPARTAGP